MSVLSIFVSALAVLVSVLSFFSTRQVARWQASTAREKLKQDLYDRRFAIYMAFHELLVAISENDDSEVELRNANAARAHSPFLLDERLTTYLEGLHREAFGLNARVKLIRDQNIPKTPEDVTKFAQDRLAFTNKISGMIEQFKPFLRLTDLS